MPVYPYDITSQITNPDAESNLTGWTKVSGTDFQTLGTSPNKYWQAGAGASGSYRQDVALPSDAYDDIDNELLYLHLSHDRFGWSDEDRGRVSVEFYTGAMSIIGSTHHSYDFSGFDLRLRDRLVVAVPANARTVRIIMLATRVNGTNCDSIFDDFEMVLRESSSLEYAGASFAEDFGEGSSAPLSSFQPTGFFNEAVLQTRIVERSGSISGLVMEVQHDNSSAGILSWLGARFDTARTWDVFARMRQTVGPTAGWRFGVALTSALNVSTAYRRMYIIGMTNLGQLGLIKYTHVGSSPTFTSLATANVEDIPLNQDVDIKVRFDAGRVRAKYWPSGGAEPGSWQIDHTDTSYRYVIPALFVGAVDTLTFQCEYLAASTYDAQLQALSGTPYDGSLALSYMDELDSPGVLLLSGDMQSNGDSLSLSGEN